MILTRRRFLGATLASLATGLVASSRTSSTSWHDVQDWGVEGRGWSDAPRARYFDRLPARAESTVRPPVWSLSRHSAGMAVRFETDAQEIQVDYQLLSPNLAMPHMPSTGVSGLDLYAAVDDGPPRWVQVMKPTAQHVMGSLVSGLDAGRRVFTLYLPLYNGVEWLKLGVPEGAGFRPLPPRTPQPLVFYGTSIMHGACASRPGMAIPAILGRRFGVPTINLGFSGNGRMDPEVVELLCDLEAAAFCIDCLPNMSADLVQQRTAPLVRRLRQSHPTTPILLVEDRVNSNAAFFAARREHHQANHRALRAAFEQLCDEGVAQLHYLPGADLLGHDGEAATDGSHPNDLGFMRYAEAYQAALREMQLDGLTTFPADQR